MCRILQIRRMGRSAALCSTAVFHASLVDDQIYGIKRLYISAAVSRQAAARDRSAQGADLFEDLVIVAVTFARGHMDKFCMRYYECPEPACNSRAVFI